MSPCRFSGSMVIYLERKLCSKENRNGYRKNSMKTTVPSPTKNDLQTKNHYNFYTAGASRHEPKWPDDTRAFRASERGVHGAQSHHLAAGIRLQPFGPSRLPTEPAPTPGDALSRQLTHARRGHLPRVGSVIAPIFLTPGYWNQLWIWMYFINP